MSSFTRRELVAAGTAAALASCTCPGEPMTSTSKTRQPVVYLPHGGGPWPFMRESFGDPAGNDALRRYLEALPSVPKTPPTALLVISAHWEEDVPTLMTGAKPPLLFDYSGFPPETYELTWPAPGAPALVERVERLLQGAGFKTARDAQRGFDHGTFVPLKLAYPAPTLPTLQLALKTGLDPAEHLALGRALAPLRDEGVFIVGSGSSFHNMRAFFGHPNAAAGSEQFDAWLRETTVKPAAERARALTEWAKAPAARFAHPREEHLLPLMVCAGAAGEDAGHVGYTGRYMGVSMSAHHFG